MIIFLYSKTFNLIFLSIAEWFDWQKYVRYDELHGGRNV